MNFKVRKNIREKKKKRKRKRGEKKEKTKKTRGGTLGFDHCSAEPSGSLGIFWYSEDVAFFLLTPTSSSE